MEMWLVMVLSYCCLFLCFFLLAIPKSLLILEEFLYTSLYSFCIFKGLAMHMATSD